MEEIKCLDHGFVRLVNHMGGDLTVVRNARVSYDADWRAGQDEGSDSRLINYLWANGHTTPFESVVFTFDIKAPIFIFRQWHRHRTWSYNELSARYKELPKEFYIPKLEAIGVQHTKNKQARDTAGAVNLMQRSAERARLVLHCERAYTMYEELLDADWPRELARMVLPLNTYSHMFGTVNLLNLMKFLTLRCHSHAQYEIQVYANAILELIRPIVPVTVEAWEKSNA